MAVYIAFGGTYAYHSYPQNVDITTTIGDGRSEMSLYMLLQGGINLSIFPVTWQKPFNPSNWKYPSSIIDIEIRDVYGQQQYLGFRLQQNNAGNLAANLIGLDDGIYSIYVFTCGYVQRQIVFFTVKKGTIANTSVLMMEGAKIDITVVLQKQRIIAPIDTWIYSRKVPVRFEVYDSRQQLVGANITYISNSAHASNSTIFTVRVVGFRGYSGNATTQLPALIRWANYYDTTDGADERDYGLQPDQYTIKVYVPGYEQQSNPVIDARSAGGMSVSVVVALQRMGHLWGSVYTHSPFFGSYLYNYTYTSWVSVDMIGGGWTLNTCALDGRYDLWAPAGSYLVIYSLPGYQEQSYRLPIPQGSDVERDIQLLPLQLPARVHTSNSRFHSWVLSEASRLIGCSATWLGSNKACLYGDLYPLEHGL